MLLRRSLSPGLARLRTITARAILRIEIAFGLTCAKCRLRHLYVQFRPVYRRASYSTPGSRASLSFTSNGGDQGSPLLQFASFSFDSSVVELVADSQAPGALVITPRSEAALRSGIYSQAAHHSRPASALRPVLAAHNQRKICPSTNLIVAGEACSADVYAA